MDLETFPMILKFGSNLPYELSHLGQLSRPVHFSPGS